MAWQSKADEEAWRKLCFELPGCTELPGYTKVDPLDVATRLDVLDGSDGNYTLGDGVEDSIQKTMGALLTKEFMESVLAEACVMKDETIEAMSQVPSRTLLRKIMKVLDGRIPEDNK